MRYVSQLLIFFNLIYCLLVNILIFNETFSVDHYWKKLTRNTTITFKCLNFSHAFLVILTILSFAAVNWDVAQCFSQSAAPVRDVPHNGCQVILNPDLPQPAQNRLRSARETKQTHLTILLDTTVFPKMLPFKSEKGRRRRLNK